MNAEIDGGSCGRKWSERGQRGACAMVQKGDADVANCGSMPLNTLINSSLNRSRVSLSASSPQPSVFQTLSSGSSTGPERITKSVLASRFCFSMKKVVFPDSCSTSHSSLCSRILIIIWAIIGISWVANLAIPAASAVGRSIGAPSHIRWSSSELSGGRGHDSRNPRGPLAALLLQRNTPGLSSPWKSEHSRQSSACIGRESPSRRGQEGNR